MIEDRKFSFCQRLSNFDIDELIVQCPECITFFAACCQHESFGGGLYDPDINVCHHVQIVYTDGACSNNGQSNATAGLGIAIGDPNDDDLSWSITVDESMDSAPRTSQRAELLAAINGLKKLKEAHHCFLDKEHEESPRKSAARRRAKAKEDYSATYIVVTDSEYVVKGITEWFPAWRVRLVIQLNLLISNTNKIICREEDGVNQMVNHLQILTYLWNWTNIPRP